jgi:hypothetical protein
MLDCGLTCKLHARARRSVDTIALQPGVYPDFVRALVCLRAQSGVRISFGYADAQHPIHRYRTSAAFAQACGSSTSDRPLVPPCHAQELESNR